MNLEPTSFEINDLITISSALFQLLVRYEPRTYQLWSQLLDEYATCYRLDLVLRYEPKTLQP